ncbi:hypothetical protein KP509_03G090000 [Ceratopteris richardii]|uniref:SWI/SNF complex subunit SWI3C n=1 Tax=Ceratopteris richardii TaxID=49495 RepID=A0A8T2V5H8_CERRI|nr:hypothetical protein KP509_03G090000 [Ceratopteris richardii]
MALKIKLKPRKEQQIPDPTLSQNNDNHTLSPASQQLGHQTDSAHLNSEDDGREASLKRKHPSPTSSSVSKRMCKEESSVSGESHEAPPASAGLPEVLSERCEQLSSEPLVIKQRIGSQHVSIAALLQREHQGRHDDEDSRSTRIKSPAITLENISHGQLQVISVVPSSISGARLAVSNQENAGQLETPVRASVDAAVSQQIYPFASWSRPDPQPLKSHKITVIPAHASWFKWDRIHKLERQAMPQFFFGKSKLQTPDIFIEARNAMILKYRSNPKMAMSILDVRGLGNLGEKELGQILEFLTQWGLVNYQAESISETAGFKYPCRVPIYLLEDMSGVLDLPKLPLTPLEYLYQFEVLRAPAMALKSLVMAEEPSIFATEIAVKEVNGTTSNSLPGNACIACGRSCSNHHFFCEKQADYILCPDCYTNGNLGIGMTTSDFSAFHMHPEQADSFEIGSWSDQETLMLLEALELHGDNWIEVSEFVGTKSKAQCISHFIGLSIEDRFFEDMEMPHSFTAVKTKQAVNDVHEEEEVKGIDLEAKIPSGFERSETIMNSENSEDLQDEGETYVAFEGAANPVMSLVAFLAATVGPRVAAVAAHTALLNLSEDFQAIQHTGVGKEQNMDVDTASTIESTGSSEVEKNVETLNDEAVDNIEPSLSKESYRKATSAALASSAMKTKLLADQEEREVQRLAAIIVDNQLKKLSIKLKQLGDIDAVIDKEREQMERNRQHIQTDRTRFLNSRLNSSGPIVQMPAGTGPSVRAVGPVPSIMPTGAMMPSGGLLPQGNVMQPGGMIPSGHVMPSHLARPGLFTLAPGGLAMPESPAARPPS